MSKQLQKSGIPYLTHLGGGAGCSQRIGRADGRQYPSPWEGAYLTHHAGGAGCDEDLPCAKFCWAKKLAGGRLAHLPQYRGLVENGRWTGKVWEDPDFAAKLAARKVPSVVGFWFMGDGALASEEFLRSSFEAFAANPQHQVLVLTKRPRLLMEKLVHLGKPGSGVLYVGKARYATPNVWLGVSASTQEEYDSRVSALCDPERGWPGNKWVSCEPTLDVIDCGHWLKGGQDHNDERGEGVHGAVGNRGVLNRRTGAHLETSGTAGREQDWNPGILESDKDPKGRYGEKQRSDEGTDESWEEEASSLCGAPCVDVRQSSRHPGWAGGQPQGLRPDEQQARKPGADDEKREPDTRASGKVLVRGEDQEGGRPALCRRGQGNQGLGSREEGSAARHSSSFRRGPEHRPVDPVRKDMGISTGIGWLVCGSADTLANGASAFTPDMARSLRDQCEAAGVPFWLKQGWACCKRGNSRACLQNALMESLPITCGMCGIEIPPGQVVEAPLLDGYQHLAAPEPIAAILRREGKLS